MPSLPSGPRNGAAASVANFGFATLDQIEAIGVINMAAKLMRKVTHVASE